MLFADSFGRGDTSAGLDSLGNLLGNDARRRGAQMDIVRAAVVGYGYWGPNIVRNLQESQGATVVAVCDQDPVRLTAARKRYPHLRVTTIIDDLLRDSTIDLIAVMTPVATHFRLAKASILAGKHVLVAKPLATSSAEAEELVAAADRHHRVLAVDHTFVYSPAVRKIHELVAGGELGSIYYYDSIRINLGMIQSDVNVIWDLAAHDISILDFIFQENPVSVSAQAISHLTTRETLAYILIRFTGTLVAHLNVNWLAPRKIRTVYVGGSRKMILYDDNEPTEKIKVYDCGILLADTANRSQLLVQYRTGDVVAPWIPGTEALHIECEHVLECVQQGSTPVTGGTHAIKVVRVLEAVQRSINEGGREVPL